MYVKEVIDKEMMCEIKDLTKKEILDLDENETWLLRYNLGIFTNNKKVKLAEIQKNMEFAERFSNKSIYNEWQKMRKKLNNFQKIKEEFQKKYSNLKVINSHIQNININNIYYIGDFSQTIGLGEKETSKYFENFQNDYPRKKIMLSNSSYLMFHTSTKDEHILIEDIFPNQNIIDLLKKIGINTLKDLNDENYILKYFELFQKKDYKNVPIIALFPINKVTKFLNENILTFEDFYNRTPEELIHIDPISTKEILYILSKLNQNECHVSSPTRM